MWDAIALFYPEIVELVLFVCEFNVIASSKVGMLSFSTSPKFSMKLVQRLASLHAREDFEECGESHIGVMDDGNNPE